MGKSINSLFKPDRYLMQVVLSSEDKARAHAIQLKLGHATLGRIWRHVVRTGLDELESDLKKGRVKK